MADLVAADPEGDPQHFRARHLLAKGCIEAGARLLYEPEMERSGVGDGLDMVIRSEIRVVPGDRGELSLEQGGQRLFKFRAEIGVPGAAIADVPAGINAELR